ncbi:hypothetical protein EVJ29_09525 [Exiguobacterium sp. SH4S7]|uniref:hypothetical protein n=1 Tax=Exiguobacterium sp. SH4S7 TaxID=2510958 RepID=UPI00103B883B|nr:hypothetical protein [Exiguobacterium sp. SH4S7]TCI35689.1 hypothetical protein EVJ29_09525 [Exiguobacterium sp. SH4S7]
MDRLFDFMKEVRRITLPYGYGREGLKAIDAEEMDQVKIAESSGRTRFNEQFLVELNRLNDIKVFADMLRNADEFTGETIHNEPDFDLEIRYKGDDVERYHLWLGRVGSPSVLMNVSQTHLVYKVPADVTDRLILTLGIDD